MRKTVTIGNKTIGDNHPCFIIAEIGINHNGSLNNAKKLIKMAYNSGCDAVKFQKRTVDKVYTKEELQKERESIFGTTNGDLKRGLEFGFKEYEQIDKYCRELGILWFASCWDVESVDFIEQFNVCAHKIASACITDFELLEKIKKTKKPILISTGMSTQEQIDKAVDFLGEDNLIIFHCTSTYPTSNNEINLNYIKTLREKYSCPIGFSGHERGIMPSTVAASMGANAIERHITLDRAMWGTDQAASLEMQGLSKLVRDIRELKEVMGDGVKKVYPSEIPIIKKLRRK